MDKLHFDDLTAITCPFGLLDDDTKARLQAHGGPYDAFGGSEWEYAIQPFWSGWTVYRVAPPKPEPLWLDWSVLAPEWRYAARDEDGKVFAYQSAPRNYHKCWAADDFFRRIDNLLSPAHLRTGTVDWRDSLITRPEGV